MMDRKKTIDYNDDTENYLIELRTTGNLTIHRAIPKMGIDCLRFPDGRNLT